MPILRQEVILNIAGNLKALVRLEAGITRGALPASGQSPAPDQEHGRQPSRRKETGRRDRPYHSRAERDLGKGRQDLRRHLAVRGTFL